MTSFSNLPPGCTPEEIDAHNTCWQPCDGCDEDTDLLCRHCDGPWCGECNNDSKHPCAEFSDTPVVKEATP